MGIKRLNAVEPFSNGAYFGYGKPVTGKLRVYEL